MSSRTFEAPIETIVGLGIVRPIRTIEEAYSFLMDWRGLRECDAAHAVALKTVRAALAGEIETETARSFVEAFAKRAGILAPKIDAAAAAQASGAFAPQRPV
jgi:hypothetical protein